MTNMLEQIKRAEEQYPPHLYDLVFDESGTLIGAVHKRAQEPRSAEDIRREVIPERVLR